MKYMGSKSRIKKYIVPILQKIINYNDIDIYIEPFVGGANVIDSVRCNNKIGGDNSEPLIELLKHVRDGGSLPDEVSKELYDDVRNNKDTEKYEKWYLGAIGFLASYNGRYFDGGYAKTLVSKSGKIRNYYDEAKRNILAQSENIKDIEFIFGEYYQFSNIKNALIYCDIPYENTKQYGSSKNFNLGEFWKWVDVMSENNIVEVSEQHAPKNFKCIWEQDVIRTQDNNKRFEVTEKLFTLNCLTGVLEENNYELY